MSEIKVDTVGPRVDNGTLTIGAAGDTVNIVGTAGTGFPSTTINNNADNKVITGSGTANTLEAEANLTFNGNDLTLGNGNVVFGTASKGVYLGVTSATASHLLDDYEEGTFTPAWAVAGGGSLGTAPATNIGVYTKVGRSCTISIMSYILATSGTITSYTCTNLPFQSAPNSVAPAMGQEFGQTGYGMLCVNAQDDSAVKITKYDGSSPPSNAYMRVQFTYQTV